MATMGNRVEKHYQRLCFSNRLRSLFQSETLTTSVLILIVSLQVVFGALSVYFNKDDLSQYSESSLGDAVVSVEFGAMMIFSFACAIPMCFEFLLDVSFFYWKRTIIPSLSPNRRPVISFIDAINSKNRFKHIKHLIARFLFLSALFIPTVVLYRIPNEVPLQKCAVYLYFMSTQNVLLVIGLLVAMTKAYRPETPNEAASTKHDVEIWTPVRAITLAAMYAFSQTIDTWNSNNPEYTSPLYAVYTIFALAAYCGLVILAFWTYWNIYMKSRGPNYLMTEDDSLSIVYTLTLMVAGTVLYILNAIYPSNNGQGYEVTSSTVVLVNTIIQITMTLIYTVLPVRITKHEATVHQVKRNEQALYDNNFLRTRDVSVGTGTVTMTMSGCVYPCPELCN
jgi:hypothetical protein